MAGGINIPFLSNVRDFLKGTSDVEGALDDVADSLDGMADDADDAARSGARSLGDLSDALGDVADDSQDAGRDLTRNLDGAADDAGSAADRLERSFRDSLDAVRTESADAGQSVGRDMEQGTREASEGLTQMGEEGAANAREVAASFDGSASSIADGFQGLAAEALGGFGPLGAAAGVAIAAGMGLAMASIEKAKEEAQETAEAIADIAGEMIDLGTTKRGPEQVAEALTEMATTAEDGENKLQSIADTAADLGIDYANLANAMAGDSEAAARSIEELNGKIQEQKDAQKLLTDQLTSKQNANSTEGRQLSALSAAHTDVIEKLEDGKDALLDELGVLEEGTAIYDLHTEAIEGGAAATLAATEAAEASTEAAIEQAEAIRDTANAAIEASDAQVGYMASVADTTKTIEENGATLDLNTEKGRANQSALNGLAGDVLKLADANKVNGAATVTSNEKLAQGRTAFLDAATAAGMAADEANALADSYGLVPETITTAVTVTGTVTAKADLDGVSAPRTVALTPIVETSSWQRIVDSAVSGLRPPSVAVTPKIGQQVK